MEHIARVEAEVLLARAETERVRRDAQIARDAEAVEQALVAPVVGQIERP